MYPGTEIFFPNRNGNRHGAQAISTLFHKCWEMAGNPDVLRRYCTPYILRHNFATQTLTRWMEEGRDFRAVPAISECLYGASDFPGNLLLPASPAGAPVKDGIHGHLRHDRRCPMKSNAFWKKLREYFGIYLPKQRNSSEKTIDSCRMAWNILLRFYYRRKGFPLPDWGLKPLRLTCLQRFLDTTESQKGWKESTRNNRLSCIRSFFKFAAYTSPEVYTVYADLCTIPLKKGNR